MTNVLKPYLTEHLPERFELNAGEVIADTVVIVRILDLTGEGSYIPERYEYTTNMGLSFATARGMTECIRDQIEDVYKQVLSIVAEDDEDD